MRTKKPVHQRTLNILDDIAQHRLMLADALQRRHFSDVHLSGVVSWLQRRIDNEHLQTHPLYGKRIYYAITDKAVRILKSAGRHVSRSAVRPLGPDAKRTYFALALYCNPQKGSSKSIYRPAFDAELFPILAMRREQTNSDPLRRNIFYRDGDVVGYFVVDRGQPRFIADKVRPKLFDLLTPTKFPEMRALADAERFRLTVVTSTKQRADELQGELHDPAPPFPVQVAVYPELMHLLPKQQAKSSPSRF